MANPPAAPGYGKRSSSKARKREADRQEIAAGTRNHPTDRARVLVSYARVLVDS